MTAEQVNHVPVLQIGFADHTQDEHYLCLDHSYTMSRCQATDVHMYFHSHKIVISYIYISVRCKDVYPLILLLGHCFIHIHSKKK